MKGFKLKEGDEKWKFQKSKQIWLVNNMYCLEKLPAKYFKIMINYIDSMQGESKARVIKDAITCIEDHSKIPFDILENQLIKEIEDQSEREELKSKI